MSAPMGAFATPTKEEPWSVDLALKLDVGPGKITRMLDKLTVLDPDTISSVHEAVEKLNQGAVRCQGDYCIVYSASQECYFFLHKCGMRAAALAALRELEQQLQAPRGTGLSQQLAAGTLLEIGACRCHVRRPLGMGSFGVVWEAELIEGSGEVAIKEILCRSQRDLANASFEAELLEVLVEKPSNSLAQVTTLAGASASGLREPPIDPLARIPAFVASKTECISPDLWRMRIVMTKVPGMSLDRFLETWKQDAAAFSTPDLQLHQFTQACQFAREMILQLAPTFEHISTLAYHRDVNSHNILIDTGHGMSPMFGIVDFGLAVDLQKWSGPLGQSSWHLVDIGGDSRSWPMSAWLQFECGWQELAKYPVLSEEYRTMLDLHALGITAIQVLAAMSPKADGNVLPQKLHKLLVAWERYWDNATRFWKILLICFREGGDQNALKLACLDQGVHNTVQDDLLALRLALREAVDLDLHSRSAEGAAATGLATLRSIRSLFAALLELVSAGGKVGFDEGMHSPNWGRVRALLETGEVRCAGTPVRTG